MSGRGAPEARTMLHSARVAVFSLVAAVAAWSAGCGNAPPSGQADAEIRKAMVNGRQGVEARSISRGAWENKDNPALYNAAWKGTLRLTEDHGYITAVVDGRSLVKVVAKAGDELEISGN